jgi:penicillin G amidase
MNDSSENLQMRRERVTIPGLRGEIDICVDRWGVPHIRAGNLDDLFFGQGFNAARDRLWQIDLARKRGLGLLAADFGPGFLAQDRAARLFLYRGDMEAEWAAYGPDAKEICTRFAQGINAYIDLIAREPARLPPEFAELGSKPDKWRPEDVVLIRTHAKLRNATSEVLRAWVLTTADLESDLLRQDLEPHIKPHVADGLDLGSIPLALLDVYSLATVPVFFSRERLAAKLEDAAAWSKVNPAGEVLFDEAAHASNNWTIAPGRTATGRPILANDPHRNHAAPSLRYLVHLTAPGFDASGAGEALYPGIMTGHNGEAAFGLTLFFGHDEEDVYVYETRPGHPDEYRYQGAWEEMEVVEEAFAVRGAPDQKLKLRFTRHGPVVYDEPDANRAYAIRTVISEAGTTPYGACLISMRTRNFEDFRKAMRKWGMPSVNQVYADKGGTIGWVSAGFNPARPNWDGLLPVPGDGRYEWNGFIDANHLPWVRDPASGYFATANEMNWPRDWPHLKNKIPAFEWHEGSRARRINQVLSVQAKHSVADSQSLQTDVLSTPATRLKSLVAKLGGGDADARRAVALLRPWDGKVSAESGPAALFELWWSSHLKPALIAKFVPDESARHLLAPGDPESMLPALEHPGPKFGADPTLARDRLLLDTLSAAYRDTISRLGPDAAQWAWGRIHHGFFAHAVTAVTNSGVSHRYDVGPLPVGGSDSTPMAAFYRATDFRVMMGASVRIVIDVGDWDNSVWMNAPGQSGDPRSPHYADLAPLWAKGEYVPMLYSRAAVDEATETRIELRPQAK